MESDFLARAKAAFGAGAGTKASGLTWGEAFEAVQRGETVRRAGWKDCVVGVCLPKEGEFDKPFLCLIAKFSRKDGSSNVSRKAWTPYISDFQCKDWEIL